MSSKKTNHATNKKSPAHYMPANCAEISKVAGGGGNWILRDLGLQKRKRSIGNTALAKARTQLFRRGGGGGGMHFKLERTSCQQSLKYISLYNTEDAPFSTKKRNIFLCT